MNISGPALHPPVLITDAQKAAVADKVKAIVDARSLLLAAKAAPTTVAPATFNIPLTTVSRDTNFDALIQIRFRGAERSASPCLWTSVGAAGNQSPCLWVDSGNSTLIVPDYDCIEKLSNFKTDYQVLAENVTEPFGCPAKILRGPIDIPALGQPFSIENCVFYACTGAVEGEKRTANFGMGWISPWGQTEINEIPSVQAPLSYNAAYPYAEINYAAATEILTAKSEPKVAEGSSLTLYPRGAMPPGFTIFDIIKNLLWMSVRPKSLTIGTKKTSWPGKTSSAPIAMVDTGGGPVFLSDPKGLIYSKRWPQFVPSPSWTLDSFLCQSIKEDLTIVIGNQNDSFSYRIDTAILPEPARGLTLVMCNTCKYMMDNQGMNIGGLSALFNHILIDYAAGKVGFKSKGAATAQAGAPALAPH
jgi:hypothetical protein